MSSSSTNTDTSSWHDVEAERWQQIVAAQPPVCELYNDAEAVSWQRVLSLK